MWCHTTDGWLIKCFFTLFNNISRAMSVCNNATRLWWFKCKKVNSYFHYPCSPAGGAETFHRRQLRGSSHSRDETCLICSTGRCGVCVHCETVMYSCVICCVSGAGSMSASTAAEGWKSSCGCSFTGSEAAGDLWWRKCGWELLTGSYLNKLMWKTYYF